MLASSPSLRPPSSPIGKSPWPWSTSNWASSDPLPTCLVILGSPVWPNAISIRARHSSECVRCSPRRYASHPGQPSVSSWVCKSFRVILNLRGRKGLSTGTGASPAGTSSGNLTLDRMSMPGPCGSGFQGKPLTANTSSHLNRSSSLPFRRMPRVLMTPSAVPTSDSLDVSRTPRNTPSAHRASSLPRLRDLALRYHTHSPNSTMTP